jgi:hypothetical protein
MRAVPDVLGFGAIAQIEAVLSRGGARAVAMPVTSGITSAANFAFVMPRESGGIQ